MEFPLVAMRHMKFQPLSERYAHFLTFTGECGQVPGQPIVPNPRFAGDLPCQPRLNISLPCLALENPDALHTLGPPCFPGRAIAQGIAAVEGLGHPLRPGIEGDSTYASDLRLSATEKRRSSARSDRTTTTKGERLMMLLEAARDDEILGTPIQGVPHRQKRRRLDRGLCGRCPEHLEQDRSAPCGLCSNLPQREP